MDELRSENIAARDWTELAVKNVNDLLTKSAEIWFKPEAKCGAYCFGSVTVKTFAGKRFNLATYLVKQNLANFSNNFERGMYQFVIDQHFNSLFITNNFHFLCARFDSNCDIGKISLAKEQRSHG